MGENTAVWLFETSTDIMKNTWGTWVTESVLPNDLVFYNLFSMFLSHFLFFQLNLQLYSVNFQSRPHFLCFSGKGISIKEFLVVFIYTTRIHLYPSIAPYPYTPSTQKQTDDESLTFHPKHMLETKNLLDSTPEKNAIFSQRLEKNLLILIETARGVLTESSSSWSMPAWPWHGSFEWEEMILFPLIFVEGDLPCLAWIMEVNNNEWEWQSPYGKENYVLGQAIFHFHGYGSKSM